MEAIIFGFLAYFGSEIAEYTHNTYDRIQECIQTQCAEENKYPEGKIILQQGEYIIVDHELGEGNE